MSILYKKSSDVVTRVEITSISGAKQGNYFRFDFSADCGKFGTDEQLASFEFTAEELIEMFIKKMENL